MYTVNGRNLYLELHSLSVHSCKAQTFGHMRVSPCLQLEIHSIHIYTLYICIFMYLCTYGYFLRTPKATETDAFFIGFSTPRPALRRNIARHERRALVATGLPMGPRMASCRYEAFFHVESITDYYGKPSGVVYGRYHTWFLVLRVGNCELPDLSSRLPMQLNTSAYHRPIN